MSRSSQRIIAGCIGLLFLIVGAIKAFDPAAFAVDVQNYRLLPWAQVVMVALFLPWVEIVCGAALMLNIAYRGALFLTAGMLATFIVGFGSTRPRGLDIACGCFGHGVHRGYWPLLITDTLLLVLVAWLIRADLRPLSPVVRGNGAALTPPREP